MRRTLVPTLLPAVVVLLLAACGGRSSAEFEESPASAPQGGIAFAKLGYDAALKQARAEHKLLMVDVYTDWCGWCRKLDKDVFSDSTVANASHRLLAVRVDAEKDGGEEVAKRFEIESFPTVLFLDGDGKLVKRVDGYIGKSEMLAVLAALPKSGA